MARCLQPAMTPARCRSLTWALVRLAISRFSYFYIAATIQRWYKVFFNHSKQQKMSTAALLLCGYAAGICNTVVIEPLELVHTRVLASSHKTPLGIRDVVSQVYSTRGIAGFYSGWESTFYTSASPAIQNTVFDQARVLLLRGRSSLGWIESFWLGALAKVIATNITFPMMRAKTVVNNTASTPPPTIYGVVEAAYRSQGIAGVYQGLAPTLTKGVLQSAVMLTVKERLDRAVRAAFGVAAR